MAATTIVYANVPTALLTGAIKTTNTWKVMLTTNTYTPDQDTHVGKSDVTNEISGTGYTAGGYTLDNLDIDYDDETKIITITADNIVEADCEFTARKAVIYDDTAPNKPLITCTDFGADKTASLGQFKLNLENGVLQFKLKTATA